MYYAATGMNRAWIEDEAGVLRIGYSFTGLLITLIAIHVFFLFRSMLFNYQEKLFRRRGGKNRFVLYTCMLFSRRLREQRRRINHLRWDRELESFNESKAISEKRPPERMPKK